MLEMQIECLKNRLNRLVKEGLSSDKVYSLSVELDKLIVKYYKEDKIRSK